MNNTEKAIELFQNGRSCAQSVLLTFCQDHFKSPHDAARIGAGFEAGVAFTGNLCGVVTGGMMTIGLKYGHACPNEEIAKELLYKLSKEFLARFESCCGTTHCNQILGVDIRTQEGIGEAIENKLFTTVCPKAIRCGVEILDDILNNNKQ